MLKNSHIPPNIQAYIRSKLHEIEQSNQIKIIHAIESGSRAWGFPSIDSDYDIRFIYVRQIKDYLSVRNYNNHVETPILFDETLGVPFDLSGWDLRKALKLAIKSNPVLIEWLVSPVAYIKNELSKDILNFANETANLNAFLYHYDRLARNCWTQISQDPEYVKTKLYCYAIRPIISMQWILKYNTTPPMDMATLCKGCVTEEALYMEICELIERKSQVKEGDLIPRSRILDFFIESCLKNEVTNYSISNANDNYTLDKADNIFHKIININI